MVLITQLLKMRAYMKAYTLKPVAKSILIALSTSVFLSSQVVAQQAEVIEITGSRIPRSELTATSPVFTISDIQLETDQAITVEDIVKKLPQAAAGANSTGATVGDSLGSSTIDLRGLGQNRTLVLVNGSRVVPFSFRNAVDVNSIPQLFMARMLWQVWLTSF
jgi:iron complex outermembrane receptor protein